jgi:hypothetical protein
MRQPTVTAGIFHEAEDTVVGKFLSLTSGGKAN